MTAERDQPAVERPNWRVHLVLDDDRHSVLLPAGIAADPIEAIVYLRDYYPAVQGSRIVGVMAE